MNYVKIYMGVSFSYKLYVYVTYENIYCTT